MYTNANRKQNVLRVSVERRGFFAVLLCVVPVNRPA